MAKITALPETDALTGDEFLPIVQGRETKRTTMTAFRALITPFLQNWYKGDRGDVGEAANTFESLVRLKGLDPVVYPSAILADGLEPPRPYAFVRGDYTGAANDDDIVALDGTPLAEGALVAQSAASLTFKQDYAGSRTRRVQEREREKSVTPDDFVGTDTARVLAAFRAAFDLGRPIRLTRRYRINQTIVVRGGLQLSCAPGSAIVWEGAVNADIMQDSSLTNAADVNIGINIKDLEIVGNSLLAGDSFQIGINFYRTGKVALRRLTVHGVGGSGIRWGTSMADTVDVLVAGCSIYDCRHGDALQGVGRKIVIRNNSIGKERNASANFGDTGIALLHDFSTITNPEQIYSSDVLIDANTIIGNYDDTGAYVGNGSQIQTGIAFGPFAKGVFTNIRVINNTLARCYLNIWGIVMDNVLIDNNDLGPHTATATGNMRFDGLTNATITRNRVRLQYVGTGPDYSAILLAAQRNVFGASTFDADIAHFRIAGNTITVRPGIAAQGVRATFEQVNGPSGNAPAYTSRLLDGKIEDNIFIGVTTPIALAPQTGATANVCSNIVIAGNMVDGIATSLILVGGNPNQYNSTRLVYNQAPSNVPPWSGTGAASLIVQHKAYSSGIAASGVPTGMLVLPPSGNVRVDLHAWIQANDADFSASATILVNGGKARIASQSDGMKPDGTKVAIATLTGDTDLARRTVRVIQSTGGDNVISLTATYS